MQEPNPPAPASKDQPEQTWTSIPSAPAPKQEARVTAPEPVQAVPPVQSPPAAKGKQKSGCLKAILLLAGVIGVVVILAVATLLWLNLGSSTINEGSDGQDASAIQEIPLSMDEMESSRSAPQPTLQPTPIPQPTLQPTSTNTPIPAPSSTSVPPTPADEPGAAATGELEFYDDFSKTDTSWLVEENDSAAYGIEEGRYFIHAKKIDYYWSSPIPSGFLPLVVQFDAWVAEGYTDGEYGVICYFKDWNNFSQIAIVPEYGVFQILTVADGEVLLHTESGWQSSTNFVPSPTAKNNVVVGCSDAGIIDLWINYGHEGEWSAPEGLANGAVDISLYATGREDSLPAGFKVYFDDVYAWFPEP
jgi:hypothetical protein